MLKNFNKKKVCFVIDTCLASSFLFFIREYGGDDAEVFRNLKELYKTEADSNLKKQLILFSDIFLHKNDFYITPNIYYELKKYEPERFTDGEIYKYFKRCKEFNFYQFSDKDHIKNVISRYSNTYRNSDKMRIRDKFCVNKFLISAMPGELAPMRNDKNTNDEFGDSNIMAETGLINAILITDNVKDFIRKDGAIRRYIKKCLNMVFHKMPEDNNCLAISVPEYTDLYHGLSLEKK